MTVTLRLGVARRDITPLYPLPLAGFGHRIGEMEGEAHPLYLKAVVMQTSNISGARALALIVSADIIWWGSERMERIYAMIRQRWGISSSAVILNATHTHSGPQTSDRFGHVIGRVDQRYVEFLEMKLAEAIEEAFGNLEPVTMERGIGHCGIGINRRRLEDGQILMAPNEEGIVDPELNVIRFVAENNRQKAIMVHFACHPTTTDQNVVSSEFPGVAMALVEQHLGADTMAFYLQGCCGDVRPRLVKDGEFYRGGNEEVIRFGTELADQVMSVLHRPMRCIRPGMIGSRTATVELPLEAESDTGSGSAAGELPLEAEPDTGSGSAAAELPLEARPDTGSRRWSVPFHIRLVSIADELSLLAMDGEVVTEYGSFVKEQFAGKVLPVGYSNGMLGYIPTAEQLAEGGYEADESYVYFHLPARFAPSVEEIIKQEIREMLSIQDGGNQDEHEANEPISK
ncbi:hypothetical protein D3P07_02160 [Paenibacillus sp. 1011MAR3C5]|uniref:neutral/alkaline non-lysosomal ceramidase N-terminal domain-containing protein n=1 Tax=Paenibacillus sp. 1011MAR3C5 TaxID=1675787 RepID=UPI000E6CF5C8|nr:neutral/alkaline non-lysosomal ceramidase N-terminal domain-containing protein [Paenibacillus sp. 1011MAR3C5]RJE90909.1 hypothetical protein D3P07_02160 [Paenibacillus sp. 1011MAR3C5]